MQFLSFSSSTPVAKFTNHSTDSVRHKHMMQSWHIRDETTSTVLLFMTSLLASGVHVQLWLEHPDVWQRPVGLLQNEPSLS